MPFGIRRAMRLLYYAKLTSAYKLFKGHSAARTVEKSPLSYRCLAIVEHSHQNAHSSACTQRPKTDPSQKEHIWKTKLKSNGWRLLRNTTTRQPSLI